MVKMLWKGQEVIDIIADDHTQLQKEFLLSKFMGTEAEAIEYTVNSIYPNFIELTEDSQGTKMETEDIKRVVKQIKEAFNKIERTGINKILKDIPLPSGTRNEKITASLDKPYPDIKVSESGDPRKQAEFSGNLSERVASRRQDKRLRDMLEGKYVLSKDEFNTLYNMANAKVAFSIDDKEIPATGESPEKREYSLTATFELEPDIPKQKTILRSSGLANVAFNEIIMPGRQTEWTGGSEDKRSSGETDWYKQNRERANIKGIMSSYDRRTKFNQLITDLENAKAKMESSEGFSELSKYKQGKAREGITARLKELRKQREAFEELSKKESVRLKELTSFPIDRKLQQQIIDKGISEAGGKVKRKVRTDNQLLKSFEKEINNKIKKLDLYDIFMQGSDAVNAHYVTKVFLGLTLVLKSTDVPLDTPKLNVKIQVIHVGELDVLQHRRFLTGKFISGNQVRTAIKERYDEIGHEKYADAPASPQRELLVKSVLSRYEKLERKIQKMEETVNRVLGDRNE